MVVQDTQSAELAKHVPERAAVSSLVHDNSCLAGMPYFIDQMLPFAASR